MNEIIEKFEKDIEIHFKDHTINSRINRNISKNILDLVKNGSINILHGKLHFTYKNWKEMDAQQSIKERRQEVHYLVNHFIKKKIIHGKSDPFPKNLGLHSLNSLPPYFLNTPLPQLDSAINFKEQILDTLNQCTIDKLEKYLYLYLYLFAKKNFTHFQLSTMNENNHFWIDEQLYFILPHNLDKNVKQSSFDIIHFDPYISSQLKRLLDSFDGENLFSHNYIFSLEKKDYIDFINTEIKHYDQTLGAKTIKDAMKLDIQLTSSPFFATISYWKIYPNQTLAELDCLHPNTIPETFLNREIALKKNKTNSITTKSKDIFDNLEEELENEDKTLEIIRTINKLKTNPKHIYKKKASIFINSLQKAIYHCDNETEIKIATYLIERLQCILDNTLAPQTFKNNLQILNRYIFLPTLYSKELTSDMFMQMQENIHNNENIEESSKAKYIQILNHFFSFSYNVKLDTVIANSHPHRSMIFDDELKLLVNTITEQDKKFYNIQKNTSKNFYKSHMRAVFLILLRYSGLRKNELRSRRLSDWYPTEAGYAIDVNRKGFKQMLNLLPEEAHKGLKNRSARRRVTFTIEDRKLRSIVDKFYSTCQKMNKKFVFLEVTEQTIYSRPVPVSSIDGLNTFMQSTLNREVVLHSLRHSFVSYNVAKILANEEQNSQKEIFELCNMIGHSDPTVMINNYLHIDHMEHLRELYTL